MASPNVSAGGDVTQLVTTTLMNYHKQLADNVSNSNAVLAQLKSNGRTRVVEGGRRIATPLTYAEETFAWYSGTELLSRAVKETISEAEYDPANAVASVTLSGPDLAKNRSKERIINLIESKLENAESTMKNNVTKATYSDGSVAKSFVGLKAMVTADGLGTVGGIVAGSWPFWKNQFQGVARATGLQYPALKTSMNALWMKLVRGTEHPDLIVADGEVYSTYESGLQENQRYQSADLGKLGFQTLMYKQAPLVFDGAATGISTAPAGTAYFLNTKYLKLEIFQGRNFEMLDLPDQSPDMDAVTRHLGFMGCLTLSNRAMQGVLTVTGT
jgi:hypothetical protein